MDFPNSGQQIAEWFRQNPNDGIHKQSPVL